VSLIEEVRGGKPPPHGAWTRVRNTDTQTRSGVCAGSISSPSAATPDDWMITRRDDWTGGRFRCFAITPYTRIALVVTASMPDLITYCCASDVECPHFLLVCYVTRCFRSRHQTPNKDADITVVPIPPLKTYKYIKEEIIHFAIQRHLSRFPDSYILESLDSCSDSSRTWPGTNPATYPR